MPRRNNASGVDFRIAEVVIGETSIKPYEDTYKYIPNDPSAEDNNESTINSLFTIWVQTYSEYESKPFTARPANNNIKQIPLIGEQVIIFKALNQESHSNIKIPQWYYLPAYGINSEANDNRLFGVAKYQTEPAPEEISKTFIDRAISSLQPYEGDILLEGRWGNTIRLGSSISNDADGKGFYTLMPTWNTTHENRGDPIIILSNRDWADPRNNKDNKEFVVEDIENAGSSLYLTSTQNFPNFTLSKNLTISTTQDQYALPQLIGSAYRITLQATDDIIVLDSVKRVTINTPDIRIGDETASDPMVHGSVLVKLLQELIIAVQCGNIGVAGQPSSPLAKALLESAQTKLKTLNSKKYFIKKT